MMVKCKVIVDFYDNVESKSRKTGEEFECLEERAEYLSGKNKLKLKVVDVIEVIPENVSHETKEDNYEIEGTIDYNVPEGTKLEAKIKPAKKTTRKKKIDMVE